LHPTTASFRTIYTLVVMEIGSRGILHVNSTAHPTAAWTTQQLREVFAAEHSWRYLLHDRDAICSAALDDTARSFDLAILKSPPRCPKANAFCERLIGTVRCECLDWIIPLGEARLRAIIREWAAHYYRGRPHSALRSVPEPTPRHSRRVAGASASAADRSACARRADPRRAPSRILARPRLVGRNDLGDDWWRRRS
jgi:transposase InsO family protein